MSRIFRVLIGYLAACAAAVASFMVFSGTHTLLADMDSETAMDHLFHYIAIIALFGLPFAFAVIAYGERHFRRDWLYYALAGIAIMLFAFFSQHISEDSRQTWHIADSNYPLIAFITSGFLSGLAYWLISGRLAGLGAKPMAATNRTGATDVNRKPGTPGNRPNPQRS